MKVYAVLEDFGIYDGGAHVLALYRDKGEAERHKQAAEQEKRGYPTYDVEEYEVI